MMNDELDSEAKLVMEDMEVGGISPQRLSFRYENNSYLGFVQTTELIH